MYPIQHRHRLKIFHKLMLVLFLVVCSQIIACTLGKAKVTKPEPVVRVQKVAKGEGIKEVPQDPNHEAGPDQSSDKQVWWRDIVRSVKTDSIQTTPLEPKQIEPKKKGEQAKDQETPEKIYTGKPISLDFQDADIRSVLRLISEISNHNLVIDPDVTGKVTINLYQPVPWDHALDIILKTNRLAMKMEGNIIRVGSQKTFAMEEDARLKAIQAKQLAEQTEKKDVPLYTEIIRVNYAKAAKLREQLSPMLSSPEGLLEKASIIIDERTNSLIIKDTAESIKKIKRVLNDLDKETPQVMIESRIVETTKAYSKELGVRWGGGYKKETNYRFPRTVDVTGIRGGNYAVNLPNTGDVFGGMGFNLGHINDMIRLKIELDSMESTGKGRIISNPRIATLDNEMAIIESGAKVPYPSVDKDGNPTTNFVDASIKLGVTPQITPNDFISLQIEADKSEPDWSKKVNGVPSITKRTATTKLIVKDGDTTVIGGLYQRTEQHSERKVPWFGNIPGIKWLFKARSNEEAYDELLIFITPRIMKK